MTQQDLQELRALVADLKKQRATTSARIWDLAMKAAVPAVIALAGWAISHEVRVSLIESNRFTAKDAAELERQLKQDLPPMWLREELADIKLRLRNIEAKVK